MKALTSWGMWDFLSLSFSQDLFAPEMQGVTFSPYCLAGLIAASCHATPQSFINTEQSGSFKGTIDVISVYHIWRVGVDAIRAIVEHFILVMCQNSPCEWFFPGHHTLTVMSVNIWTLKVIGILAVYHCILELKLIFQCYFSNLRVFILNK